MPCFNTPWVCNNLFFCIRTFWENPKSDIYFFSIFFNVFITSPIRFNLNQQNVQCRTTISTHLTMYDSDAWQTEISMLAGEMFF